MNGIIKARGKKRTLTNAKRGMLLNGESGKKAHGDYLLVIAVTVLALVGTVFIYSASNYSAAST